MNVYQLCDVTTRIHVAEQCYNTIHCDSGSRFIWLKVETDNLENIKTYALIV